jgi:hypothetical protein
LKSKHINLQEYLNHKDINNIGSAVCDSVVVDDEGNSRVREEVIKKGQLFEWFNAVKFIFLGLCCMTPSTILCGKVKQRRIIHHKVSNCELQLGCLAMSYKKSDSPMEGVKGQPTSYMWYVRSLACSLSMHDKVPRSSNCVNYLG